MSEGLNIDRDDPQEPFDVREIKEEVVRKEDLREFSMLTDPESRMKLATEIKERRRLREQLASESTALSERKKILREMEKNVAETENSLAFLSRNLAVKVLNWRKGSRIAAELMQAEEEKERASQQVGGQNVVVEELEEILQGRRDASEDGKLLEEFYGGTKKK